MVQTKQTIKKRSNYACGLRSRFAAAHFAAAHFAAVRVRETLFSGNVSICGGIKFVARSTSWVAAVI